MRKLFILPLLPLILTGCSTPKSTPYQPLEKGEGYTSRQLEDGHEIQVRGNHVTTHATLENHFHKRAKEICHPKDYKGEISKEVLTNVKDAEFSAYGHAYSYTPTTISQLPYVTGQVKCLDHPSMEEGKA
jgi:hypothetical protein